MIQPPDALQTIIVNRLRQWSHSKRRSYPIRDVYAALSFDGVPSREVFDVAVRDLEQSGEVVVEGESVRLKGRD